MNFRFSIFVLFFVLMYDIILSRRKCFMNYKQELIKRYEYLYENVHYILGSYVHQQSTKEFLEDKIKYKSSLKKPLITLKSLDLDMLLSIEEFLFCDFVMEQIPFYKELEVKKKDTKFLKEVKKGLRLMKVHNNSYKHHIFDIKLDMWNLLKQVREFIMEQSNFYQNKKLKLDALDEYFRICRYANDGKVWTSGYELTGHDVKQMDSFMIVMPKQARPYLCGSSGYGIMNTKFIYYLACDDNKRNDNKSILSEKEKQDIYLKFHDEMPWDFHIIDDSTPRQKKL